MNYQVQKSSTGVTFNYKINMDFLINNKKNFVWCTETDYLHVSVHSHRVLSLSQHCLHVKTCVAQAAPWD